MKSERQIIEMIIKTVIKKHNIMHTGKYINDDLKEYDDKITTLLSVFYEE